MTARLRSHTHWIAAQRLLRTPAFAFAVVSNLALGIGGAALAVTLLTRIVLRPLPYPDAADLVVIHHEMPGIDMEGEPTSFGGFQGLTRHYDRLSRRLDGIALWGIEDAAATAAGAARSVRKGYASADFFDVLRVDPLYGRTFRGDDATPEWQGSGAIVLGHAYWETALGSDSRAVGATVNIEGYQSEVVGVLPTARAFPLEGVSLWAPRTDEVMDENPEWIVQSMIGRLGHGSTPAALERELADLMVSFADAADDPFIRRAVREGRLRPQVTPLKEWVGGGLGRGLWLVNVAALLLWAVALVNATGMILMRSQSRRRDWALHHAVGATRLDVIRSQLGEIAVLAVVGGAVGGILAAGGMEIVVRRGTETLPRLAEIQGLGAGWVAVGALTLATALTLALAPFLGSWNRGLENHALSHAYGGDARTVRARTAVAVLQLTVSVVFLVAAGLLIRSGEALARVDTGFTVEDVAAFRITHPFREIQEAGATGGVSTPFFDAVSRRLIGLPGVTSVGYGSCVPMSRDCTLAGLTLGRPNALGPGEEASSLAGLLQVGPGFLETLGVPLLAGRTLGALDHENRTNAIVLSSALAARLFGAEDPIGREIVSPDVPDWQPFTVVGVVGNVRQTALRSEPESMAYLAPMLHDQLFELASVWVVVATSIAESELGGIVRQAVSQVRPDAPVSGMTTMARIVENSTSRLRATVWLLWGAASATLILAILGVYGVVSFSVVLRRREFGIRLALGEGARGLYVRVLRLGARISLTGLAIGLVVSLLAGRLLTPILFEVGPRDLGVYVVVAAITFLSATGAASIPALRAGRQDPAHLLRSD